MSAIGTLAWSRRSGGYLSSRDHLRLATQAALYHLDLWRQRHRRPIPAAAPHDATALRLPDTPATRQALDHAALASQIGRAHV